MDRVGDGIVVVAFGEIGVAAPAGGRIVVGLQPQHCREIGDGGVRLAKAHIGNAATGQGLAIVRVIVEMNAVGGDCSRLVAVQVERERALIGGGERRFARIVGMGDVVEPPQQRDDDRAAQIYQSTCLARNLSVHMRPFPDRCHRPAGAAAQSKIQRRRGKGAGPRKPCAVGSARGADADERHDVSSWPLTGAAVAPLDVQLV
jgi:hypothetical protein